MIEQLREEIRIGDAANTAYNVYLKNYFDDKKASLYDSLLGNISNDEVLIIRQELIATIRLESDVLQDIETGKFARMQISE